MQRGMCEKVALSCRVVLGCRALPWSAVNFEGRLAFFKVAGTLARLCSSPHVFEKTMKKKEGKKNTGIGLRSTQPKVHEMKKLKRLQVKYYATAICE